MFNYLSDWSKRPFNPEMDWKGWALTIIFIFVVAGLWASTLNVIKKVA